jgi:hypothetical protein
MNDGDTDVHALEVLEAIRVRREGSQRARELCAILRPALAGCAGLDKEPADLRRQLFPTCAGPLKAFLDHGRTSASISQRSGTLSVPLFDRGIHRRAYVTAARHCALAALPDLALQSRFGVA